MKRLVILHVVAAICLVPALVALGDTIRKEERDYQNEIYEIWWEAKLNWKFEDLPKKAMVEKYRMPYSGYIYLDKSGGTASVGEIDA